MKPFSITYNAIEGILIADTLSTRAAEFRREAKACEANAEAEPNLSPLYKEQARIATNNAELLERLHLEIITPVRSRLAQDADTALMTNDT